jgi:uncharacterized membrane protein
MEHFFQIAVGTVTMRPYVFAFLAVYLVAAVLHLGWRTTLWFTVAGYLISFASEVCSINTGFPYGWYFYIDATKSRELWIAGVPFFDSLSYVFLAYCSYATALLAVAPVKVTGGRLVLLETRAIRRSLAVLILGALFQVFLDIIIDPVALQGNRWFLGQIYGYRVAGVHFGVPISNYAGWLLTSFCLVLALQRIDARVGKGMGKPAGAGTLANRALFGPLLYLSVIAFNLSITFLIGERLLGTTGIFIFTLPAALVVIGIVRRANRFTREELAGHLHDYPWSDAGEMP